MGHSVTTLKVNTIEPAGSTLTLGASGDSVVLADDVKSNTYKDAGGNTLFTSDGSGNLSSVNSGFGDSIKLLSTTTASNSASIEFTLPTAYKQVKFGFYNITPATDSMNLQVSFSTDGTTWGMTKTTTNFFAEHTESDSTGFAYQGAHDLAQSTSSQVLGWNIGNGSDESLSGVMNLFSPSSTTYVKHFYSTLQWYQSLNASFNSYVAGYINDAANDVSHLKFSMSSGNIATGTIKMYGIS